MELKEFEKKFNEIVKDEDYKQYVVVKLKGFAMIFIDKYTYNPDSHVFTFFDKDNLVGYIELSTIDDMW